MRLTVLGGGGFRVPLVYRALLKDAASGRGACTELVLYDTDSARLAAIGQVLTYQAQQHRAGAGSTDGFAGSGGSDGSGTATPASAPGTGPGPRPGPAPAVRTTTDLDEALDGADFVFSAIRVGGLAARARDERIPLGEGVLGQETTGPGGVLYGLRTVPVALRLAERIAERAPQAWVINFTNPAGMVTEAMSAVLGHRVIGICDSPVGLCRRAARAAGADPDRAGYDYVGLNHLGWLRRLTVDGEDALPQLLADTDALTSFEEGKLFGAEWLRALGALPNEYLHYYYFARESLAAVRDAAGEKVPGAAEAGEGRAGYGTGGATRGEFLRAQQSRFYGGQPYATPEEAWQAWEATRLEREETYMAENRQATGGWQRDACDLDGGGYDRVALALMRAIHHNERTTLILNVPNRNAVPGLDSDAVVEVPCQVDADGARPLATGPVAPDQLGLMLTLKAVERAAIEAATTGSRTAALRALALHPLTGSVQTAARILDAAGIEGLTRVTA